MTSLLDTQIYQEMKEAHLVASAYQFSEKYLGRSRNYYSVLKARKMEPSIGAILALEYALQKQVEIAGGVNLFGIAGKHSPWMKFEDLLEKQPDIIMVMPCGFDIERTRKEMSALEKQLTDPNVYADVEKLMKTNQAYEEMKVKLEEANKNWEVKAMECERLEMGS